MALSPGDIVFVGWDADNEDISFLATAPVAAGEVIYFTDDEWDGTAFVGSEQLFEWVVPAGGLDIGDVVTIDMVRANQPGGPTASIDIGGPVDYIRGGGALAGGNEMFWAFQGERVGDTVTPESFISVIANEADGGDAQTPNLAGTGLTTSTGAVIIDGDEDYMEFAQDGAVFADQAAILAAIGDPTNWVTADGRGNNNPNGVGFDLDFSNIYCFTPGAMIDTPSGRRAVETLEVGDAVLTKARGAQPIREIIRRRLTANDLARAPHLRPIVIQSGAFGAALPDRDLRLSPQHRVLITDRRASLLFGAPSVLAPAKALSDGRLIRIDRRARSVEYIHLVFDNHEIIFSNGLATESLHPIVERREEYDAASDAPAALRDAIAPAAAILTCGQAAALKRLNARPARLDDVARAAHRRRRKVTSAGEERHEVAWTAGQL